jgi:DNA-binding MarR family transcriptional regulator
MEKKRAAKHPPLDVDYLEPLKKIRQIVRFAQKHSAAIERQCGVNGAQLWLMTELHETPYIRVGDLVSRMAVHQSTVSNLVDGLVRKGLIEKVSDDKDRRVTLLVLTPSGSRVLRKGPRPTRGILPHALRSMDSQSLVNLNDSLQVLIDTAHGVEEELGMRPLPFNISAR